MAYRERERGSNRSYYHRQRPQRQNHEGSIYPRGSEELSPAPAIVLLKRKPTSEALPIPMTTTASSLEPSPKSNDKKPLLILQRRPKPSDIDTPLRSTTPTLLPEVNSQTEVKVKEKVHTTSLVDLLKPYKCTQQFSTPFIDNNMKLGLERHFDFLTTHKKCTDFLVVSAIGRPHTGKSTILSYLAENTKFGNGKAFQPRKRTEEKECSIYMASNNILYIEMASLFNGSAAADLISTMDKYGNLENAITIWNLRLMRWVLSISHVVLLVSESLIDPNLLQIINSAEMISSMEYSSGDGSYPELLYICNKTQLSSTDELALHSQLESLIRNVTGKPPRRKRNVFLLPHKKFTCGHDDNRYEEFKTAVNDLNTYFRAPFAEDRVEVTQKVTLLDWFQFANRFWEDMNQPNYFTNYVKRFP